MNKFVLLLITIIAIIAGIILLGINGQWIIIRNPLLPANEFLPAKKVSKFQCALTYWSKGDWHKEQTTVLYSENQSNNIKQLINAWLTLIEAEQIVDKKIILESALISESGQELFLSFSRNIFAKEESLFSKWMLIEGILKTVHENNKNIQRVRFLVNHQPLRDTQLDFSFSWSIQGFMNNE